MARQQGASPMAQPRFDDEEPQVVTPFKDHVAPSSGSTPLGESSFNHRIHLRMSGGPDLNTQPQASRAGARSRRSNCTRQLRSASEAVRGGGRGQGMGARESARSAPKQNLRCEVKW